MSEGTFGSCGPDPDKPHNFAHGNRIGWECDVCRRGPYHKIHKKGRSGPDLTKADEHGWLPIESAPRDGKGILTIHDGVNIRISFWVAASRGPNKPGYWTPAYRATHWQPLPSPPEDMS